MVATAGILVALWVAILPVPARAVDANEDIVVHVAKDGQHIVVDVDCPVDAPASIIWEVLTDYDHMAQFVSNLEYSRIEDSAGELLRVRQTGKASRGPLTLRFDSVREIELVPHREIRSRLVSGDLKASDFVTRIVEVDLRIHIVNSGHYTPNMWVPPIIGPALIAAETQKQFGEIRAEILRRSATGRPRSRPSTDVRFPPVGAAAHRRHRSALLTYGPWARHARLREPHEGSCHDYR